MIEDLETFQSSIGTNITLLNDGINTTIQKKIELNDAFSENKKELLEYIGIYVDQLSNNGIKIPAIIEKSFENNTLIFLCEYGGESILNLMSHNALEDTINNTNIFDQILKIIKNVQISKIDFDPHPKNYVLLNGVLSFIDFTPPYSKPYYDLRLKKAKQGEIKILNNFFNCMDFKVMGYHLAGDILKMNKNNMDHMPLIFKQMKNIGIIEGNFDSFLSKAESIILKERERESANIFLM